MGSVRFVALVGALAVGLAFLPAGPTVSRSGTATVLSAGFTRPILCGTATTRCNLTCPGEDVFYDPGNASGITLPGGYKAQVFARDLNFPTSIAFVGTATDFKVLVIESGSGLPGRCNTPKSSAYGGAFDNSNPFTPDVLVMDSKGNIIQKPIGKPSQSGMGFQPCGPAIGLTLENGFGGGRLFATDSNQGTDGASPCGITSNNSSRIVTVDLTSGRVDPFISNLPTGDHPTEELLVRNGYIYWSQGSATNSGVVGRDNGGGTHQHDIPCQDVKLSQNVFSSGGGTSTSGYSDFGIQNPGGTVPAFSGAANGMHACTGAILRAQVSASDPASTVEPFSWGYRNPFGIRFTPTGHVLGSGRLFVTENGEDERGARPTNNAPDRLQLADMNSNGTPDYHGWPDQFGDLASTQAVFNPVGGPADDDPASSVGKPVRPVLAYPPQAPSGALAIEPADVAVVGPDFAPSSFVHGVVQPGAALIGREGDFGFSKANGEPEEGHDIQLVNFLVNKLNLQRFAFNCAGTKFTNPDGAANCTDPGDQAFVEGDEHLAPFPGINRPVMVLFGPDGALYLVDFGAVRDFGQSDPFSKFKNPADAPLVQIPQTGTIWKITRST